MIEHKQLTKYTFTTKQLLSYSDWKICNTDTEQGNSLAYKKAFISQKLKVIAKIIRYIIQD